MMNDWSRHVMGRRIRQLLVTGVAVGALLATVVTTTAATVAQASTIQHPGKLEICKVNGGGLSAGTPITFDILPSGPAGATVTVPVGKCVVVGSFTLGTTVTVTEQIPAGELVSAVTVTPAGNEVAGSLNLTGGSVMVTIGQGTTIVTYKDTASGTLKICKVAGFGVAVGTPVSFNYTTASGSGTVTVPAGPAPGGYCVVVGTFAFGTYKITEVIPTGDSVTSITAVPSTSITPVPVSVSVNLGTGTIRGKVGTGVTEVTYTDVNSAAQRESGYLEICKQLSSGSTSGVTQMFQFTVDGQTVSVPSGACSPAIQVTSGSETVTETPVSPYAMSACSTTPAADLVSCDPSGNTATVTVAAGGVSAETILTVTNSLASTTVTTPDSWSTSVASGTTTTASGQDPNTSLCEFPTDADTAYGPGGPSASPNNSINSDLGPDGTPPGGCASASPTLAYVAASMDSEGPPIAGTQWVGPDSSGHSGPTASVCPAGNTPSGADSCNFYVYDATFDLPDSLADCSNLQISGSMLADNQAGVFLNGNYITSQPGALNSWDGENPPDTNFTTPFAFSTPVPISDFNVSGTNTIDFVVWDASYNNTGLDYQATISESGCPVSSGPLGSSFDDSATVTGSPAGGSPTGNVTFTVCGPLSAPAPAVPCTATDYQVGSAAVALTPGANDTSTANSAEFTPTSTGYWCFDDTYSGSSSYLGSSDNSTDECFDVTSPGTSSTGTSCTGMTAFTAGGVSILSGCSDSANTGGSGTGPLGEDSGTIDWVNGETTTFTASTTTATPDLCPAGDTEIVYTITVTAGTSTSIPPGSIGVSDLCESSPPDGPFTLLSGTTFNV